MNIRLATTEDATAISQLLGSLAAQYITPEFSTGGARKLLTSLQPSAIQRYLASGYRYHLAEVDGVLIGVVGTRDNKHIYHLFVATSHHRRGIATKLWRCAREDCLAAGNGSEFTVNASRFARPFYKTLGFAEVGAEENREGVVFTPMKLNESKSSASFNTLLGK